ncbi:hypothetical protein N9V84_09400, partial [Verrucomicrobiales bacterium]|nr:hypothetical protein [Verrucomicrobiales bacterium]
PAPVDPAPANLTGSWSPIVPPDAPAPLFPEEWESHTPDGISVVAQATQFPFGRVVQIPEVVVNEEGEQLSGPLTGTEGLINPAAHEHPSLGLTYTWDTDPELSDSDIDGENDDKQFGTLLFQFDAPVKDPILHFEGLGGHAANTSNSAEFKILTPAAVIDVLSKSGDHLQSTFKTFRRKPDQTLTNPTDEVGPPESGAVAGSIRFPGIYTTIEMEWTGVGIEGSGSDAVEFVWELNRNGGADLLLTEALSKGMRPLSEVPVLLPRKIHKYIADMDAAKKLGKALFWDQQVGSDGMSCASCHFHAGSDSRTRNQVSPFPGDGEFDQLFSGLSGPNRELEKGDFPLPLSVDDSVTSAGSFHGNFKALKDALLGTETTITEDNDYTEQDPDGFSITQDGGFLNVRRVEPRNTPTMINAVFNFRNYWDGRANFFFNGENPFGPRDPDAGIYQADGNKVEVLLDHASLASQAVGPPLSALEMSSRNKGFQILGRKMLGVRPLALQKVHPNDSLLGDCASDSRGLETTYEELINNAFKPEWLGSSKNIQIDGYNYTQTEANFAFIWGVAIMIYESALVSDDAPIDRYLKGDSTALTSDQRKGLKIFMNEGKCINCHGGANFTNATTQYLRHEMINRMIMGNNEKAIYDEGFYNIGVRPTADDLGLGGKDPFGNPLGFSRQAALGINVDHLPFERFDKFEEDPHLPPQIGERVAVDGAFKTSNLRNIELTGPYFHNGGTETLEGVVEFYARGGNFSDANRHDLDADIQRIDSLIGDDTEIGYVADFMRALTDERVRHKGGIFDHPELFVFYGHSNDSEGFSQRSTNEPTQAADSILVLPAVGKDGSSHPIKPFLEGIIPGNIPDDDLEIVTGMSGLEALKEIVADLDQPRPDYAGGTPDGT